MAAVASHTCCTLTMLTIQAAITADIAQLLAIQQQTQQSEWSLAAFQEAVDLGQCWLAKWQEKTVGFIVYSYIVDEAELLNIALSPDYQGQGIAYALYKAMHKQLQKKGVKQCFLEVAKSNLQAQAFYKQVGFSIIATRKNYYQLAKGVEDALIMRIHL